MIDFVTPALVVVVVLFLVLLWRRVTAVQGRETHRRLEERNERLLQARLSLDCRDDSPIELERDRYDPADLETQLMKQTPELEGDTWTYSFVGREPEFGVSLQNEGGTISELASKRLRQVLQDLRELDNAVQESCEREAAASTRHLNNFKLDMRFIDLTGPTTKMLYYGTYVNTEWEALFTYEDGKWKRLNF